MGRLDLISDGTYLYGTTVAGGSAGLGTVFKYKINNTGINSISDNTINTISVYPNPANDNITIENTSLNNNKDEMISIYNIQGQLLIQQQCRKLKLILILQGLQEGCILWK